MIYQDAADFLIKTLADKQLDIITLQSRQRLSMKKKAFNRLQKQGSNIENVKMHMDEDWFLIDAVAIVLWQKST